MLGDAMHAVLCGTGYNLRMILRTPRLLRVLAFATLVNRQIAADGITSRRRRQK